MTDPTNEVSQGNNLAKLSAHFNQLYGDSSWQPAYNQLVALFELSSTEKDRPNAQLDQRSAFMITYGDQVKADGEKPLSTLAAFCKRWLSGIISAIHILPFFPYSSDDGFSVIDYLQVDPALGSWQDIQAFRQHFKLMFDLVINHTSASHAWFKAFLQGDALYSRYYITVDGQPDLSAVTRPRALPILTEFQTHDGVKKVWTTFSQDQPDLDFSNPQVLIEMLQVLKTYVDRGAAFIRLDAIAYLWKEIGTTCVHLPQTHQVIRLIRTFLNLYAPQASLITETNVPHKDNVAYFGDGRDEAQLVYNFSLPPLVLQAFQSGNARILSEWAASLDLPSRQVTFFNFLASHDGIGLNPARDVLSEPDFRSLVERSLLHGGRVSYKHNLDGSESPYELNINYFDALSNPGSLEPVDLRVARFCGAHAIMFSLIGVPGIYFHSLFGSRGWPAGLQLTGQNRSINRQKLELQALEMELHDPLTLRSRVFTALVRLLKIRQEQPAFDPYGKQLVQDYGDGVFAVFRVAGDPGRSVLCLQNVRPEAVAVQIKPATTWAKAIPGLVDLISRDRFSPGQSVPLTLRPYQSCWLAVSTGTQDQGVR